MFFIFFANCSTCIPLLFFHLLLHWKFSIFSGFYFWTIFVAALNNCTQLYANRFRNIIWVRFDRNARSCNCTEYFLPLSNCQFHCICETHRESAISQCCTADNLWWKMDFYGSIYLRMRLYECFTSVDMYSMYVSSVLHPLYTCHVGFNKFLNLKWWCRSGNWNGNENGNDNLVHWSGIYRKMTGVILISGRNLRESN